MVFKIYRYIFSGTERNDNTEDGNIACSKTEESAEVLGACGGSAPQDFKGLSAWVSGMRSGKYNLYVPE